MFHHPIGFYLAIASGLFVASESPEVPTGAIGIIIACTGLLGGITQLATRYFDYKQRARDAKVADLERQLQETKEALAASMERNHKRADDTGALLNRIQENVQTNSTALQAIGPVTRDLAARSGIEASIPEPAEPIY